MAAPGVTGGNGSAGASPAARRLDVVDAVRRHPWIAFGAPALILALSVAFILVVPPLYEASTSLRIDEQRSGVAVLEVLQTLSSGSDVDTEMAVLRSRSVAEDVVRALDLQVGVGAPRRALRSSFFPHIRVDTAAPAGSYRLEQVDDGVWELTGKVWLPADPDRPGSEREKVEREYGRVTVAEPFRVEGAELTLGRAALEHERIEFWVQDFHRTVDGLRSNTAVARPDRQANVVTVRYQGTDPALTQAVPNTLAATFLARRRGTQSAEARSTVDFLAEQIDTLEVQLMAAEEALRDFREENQIVSVEAEADAQVQRLAEMQAQRDLMGTEREALAELLAEVRAEELGPGGENSFRKLAAFPTLLRSTATAELLTQLAQMENLRSELLRTRTQDDRDVVLTTARIREIEEQLAAIAETYLRGLANQIASTDRTLARFGDQLEEVPAQEMTFLRLRRQAEILSELYSFLQTRQKEAQIAAAVEDQTIRVLDPALFPLEPIRPKPMLTLLLAVVVGTVVGVGGAIAREHMDRTVRTRQELQTVTGTSVLGLIPVIAPRTAATNGSTPAWQRNGSEAPSRPRPRLVGQITAGDPAAEAYRSLRTNINFSRPSDRPQVLVFTSPMPGDGKSTTAANLALVLAQQGGRVLLVDADMRRGVLNEAFHEGREPGLSNLLMGAAELEDAVRSVELSEERTLAFLPAGPRPPNPAELLSSEGMRGLLAELRKRYETVILDAPPLNLVTDAALMGNLGDGVVLVARAGVTETSTLTYAVEQLEGAQASLLGTVLNGVELREQGYYGSGRGGAYAYFDGR